MFSKKVRVFSSFPSFSFPLDSTFEKCQIYKRGKISIEHKDLKIYSSNEVRKHFNADFDFLKVQSRN